MFIGQYEHAIDEKGRLAVPAKFRRVLESGAVITKGLDGCLFLFAKDKFKKMAEGIGQLPIGKSSARNWSRLMLAGAAEAEFDKQGRIILPGILRKYATLKSQTVVIGLYDRVEIWDKAAWAKITTKVDRDAGEIAEELSVLGI